LAAPDASSNERTYLHSIVWLYGRNAADALLDGRDLGYRRQRNFERVLFFLCLSLFLFYAGSLLAINAEIYYVVPPFSLQIFSTALVARSVLLAAAVLHLHLEYAETRNLLKAARWKRVGLILAYAPVPYFALKVYALLAVSVHFNFAVPGTSLGRATEFGSS